MTYHVKELFYTLQGEGAQSGCPAVFCRFAGCNLWSGREIDRVKAVCQFCDTDFIGTDGEGGGRFQSIDALADAIVRMWQQHAQTNNTPYVVCTGGEPLLQLDIALIEALQQQGFRVAVETNGTLAVPASVDWICVSPKANAPLRQRHGHELKLVYPQEAAPPEDFIDLDFAYFFLQPMDGTAYQTNLQRCIAYCLQYPPWRLSLQMHKVVGIA